MPKARTRGLLGLLCASSASVACAASCIPATALAQDGQTHLEEVVVTAQKREQRLQDVPVAITAISEAAMKSNRITTIRDLDTAVPSLTIRNNVGGSLLPTFTIRGLFSQASAAGQDRGVGIYVDGVYLGVSNGSIFELADLQRIEVLRGPQGTLFGRNSTGGAISLITAEPTGEFGVKVTLTVGNYDQRRASATVNLPQTGPFSAKLTYTHSERRGEIRNLAAGTIWDFTPAFNGRQVRRVSPKWLGSSNMEVFGAAVKFQPDDAFSSVYRFDHSDNRYTSFNGVTYAQPLILALLPGQPNASRLTPISGDRPDAVNNAATIPSRAKSWGHSLTSTLDVTDNITVKNIIAYRRSSFFAGLQDLSGFGGLVNTGSATFAALLRSPTLAAATVGAPFLIQATSTTGTDRQFSDEIQFNIKTHFATVTAGGLYFDQTSIRAPIGTEGAIGAGRSGAFRVYPGYLFPYTGQPAGYQGRATTVHIKSYAAFGFLELHVTDKFDLVGGLRYTYDRKTGDDWSSYSAATPNIYLIDYKGDKVTYNVGVNYKISDDILVYAKYSTAFISGGSLAGFIYDPETAKSWEAGLKADWLDSTLRTNLALFDVKYGSLQNTVSGVTFGRPEINLLVLNAGDAKARGFEFETTYRPVRGLTLNGGAGYTDFEFTTLRPIVLTGNSGYVAQQRPKWTVNLAVQYESDPLFHDVRMNARLDASWKSKMFGASALPAVTTTFTAADLANYRRAAVIPSSWVVNGRLALEGFKIGGTDASLAVWARNLLDNKNKTYLGALVTVLSVSDYERARTVGVDLSVSF